MKSDNGRRFRMRNLTFDRAGIDKLVCHDGFRQTYNDGGNTISSVVQFYSLHSNHQKLFKVVKVVFNNFE